MNTDPTDGKPGLRIETAASVTLRKTVEDHMRVFAHIIKTDRAASQSVVAAYIDGLAGAVALTVSGGHGGREDAINATVDKLRQAIMRDLVYLARLRS